MDGGHKSKRLYPSLTRGELYMLLMDATLSDDEKERIHFALRQRDPASTDYQPIFVVPQIT